MVFETFARSVGGVALAMRKMRERVVRVVVRGWSILVVMVRSC